MSSDSFSTVMKIVNGDDWGYIVRDLETIIVLALLAFNFIPQRSHHSLTLPRSRIRDSAIVTLTPGDGTTAIKVESSAYFSEWKNAPKCTGETITCQKHCPAALRTLGSTIYFENHPPWRAVIGLIETVSILTQNPNIPDDGHSNHPQRKEVRPSSACTAVIDASKQ